jgi:CRP/FNR family transcriptional regulator
MDEIHALAERLQQVRQFNGIPIEKLERIIQSGTLLDCPQGKVLFQEGEPCAGFYVLVQGQVTLSKMSPEGKEGILTILEPVIMFNEVAALDGGENPITASAHTRVRVWHATFEAFHELLLQLPQAGLSLLGVLARRNRLLVNHYGDLSFRSVQARLAKHLVDISKNGQLTINRKQNSNQLIAGQVITTPEAVSRTLRTFTSSGLIISDRREIKVLDLEKLQVMAQIYL